MKDANLKEELTGLSNKANERMDMNIIKIYHHIIDYFKDNPPVVIELQRLYGENQSILNMAQKIRLVEVSEANNIIEIFLKNMNHFQEICSSELKSQNKQLNCHTGINVEEIRRIKSSNYVEKRVDVFTEIDNPMRKGFVGYLMFWEPKKVIIKDCKVIKTHTNLANVSVELKVLFYDFLKQILVILTMNKNK